MKKRIFKWNLNFKIVPWSRTSTRMAIKMMEMAGVVSGIVMRRRFNSKRLFHRFCHTACVDSAFKYVILLAACVIGHLLGAFPNFGAPQKSREIRALNFKSLNDMAFIWNRIMSAFDYSTLSPSLLLYKNSNLEQVPCAAQTSEKLKQTVCWTRQFLRFHTGKYGCKLRFLFKILAFYFRLLKFPFLNYEFVQNQTIFDFKFGIWRMEDSIFSFKFVILSLWLGNSSSTQWMPSSKLSETQRNSAKLGDWMISSRFWRFA